MIKIIIISILDWLYIKPVAKMVSKQTFYYGACGGGNMLLDMVIYSIIYNFVVGKRLIELFGVVISPQISSFLFTFPIIYLTGLWLARNISFTNALTTNKQQATRYLSVTIANIFIKYCGISFLTYIAIWPSFANAIMTIFTVVFSYLMQKYYTFRGSEID